MTFSPLETLFASGLLAFIASTATRIWCDRSKPDCVTHDELDELREQIIEKCEENRAHCSGAVISGELKGIRVLLQVLCERQGITIREQQEIVRDAK